MKKENKKKTFDDLKWPTTQIFLSVQEIKD